MLFTAIAEGSTGERVEAVCGYHDAGDYDRWNSRKWILYFYSDCPHNLRLWPFSWIGLISSSEYARTMSKDLTEEACFFEPTLSSYVFAYRASKYSIWRNSMFHVEHRVIWDWSTMKESLISFDQYITPVVKYLLNIKHLFTLGCIYQI